MPPRTPPTTRLDVLVARRPRRAVVFRRGPAKMALVLAWDLATDVVTPGQWFRGTLRPRWGDLSPDGEHLVLFLASHRPPFRTWTACRARLS